MDSDNLTISDLETMREGDSLFLAGRYKVLRRLGEGGMGSVWLAEDTKLDNRQVAIKMLPAVLAGKKGAYRQVKQEALMAMKLSHPNIATVRAFEEDEGGSPFLVMDYIEGTGLDEILAEKGALGEAETLKLLGPVAAALDHAHAKGVVHRDVKPGNVIVDKNGTPFVLDFGIAREIQETMTRVTGKFSSGTLMYMSPEQLRGRAPKPAQDVYSFAAMAYECLAGHPPFFRGAVEDQIKNEPPEELPEGVASEALRQGIMAGLAKEPEGRPGTCLGVLGRDEAAKREREKREAEEVRRKREEEALRARERARVEEAQRRKREESERLARERARAEEERRRVTAALEAERAARKEAEAAAREARRRAQAEQLEAQQAQEARGRAAGWVWFLAIVLVLGGLVAYGVWQQEQERSQAQIRGLQRDADAQRKEQPEIEAKWQAEGGEEKFAGRTKTITLPGGATMEMVWCPAGSFRMGSNNGEDDEKPVHDVMMSGFWMAKTEVTQKQWWSVMGLNPSYQWGEDLPVENVSWDDCVEFCRKAGNGLQLPTEAEWEYACRAGTTGDYSGTGILETMGWYSGNSGNEMHPVGRKQANAWGLHDMHGNVSEWCADWYGAYPSGPVTNPTGVAAGERRVHRGGGFWDAPLSCRSAGRDRGLTGNCASRASGVRPIARQD